MNSFVSLLAEYHALPLFSRRAVAAIVGACVGDAATRPVHWVYDRNIIESKIGNANPEFWPVNLSPFYSLPTGMRSCYNDESLAMLYSLTPTNIFNADRTKASLLSMFSPESAYAEANAQRASAAASKDRQPITGPWQQASITSFLKATAEGKEITGDATSKETDPFCLSIPLIAR